MMQNSNEIFSQLVEDTDIMIAINGATVTILLLKTAILEFFRTHQVAHESCAECPLSKRHPSPLPSTRDRIPPFARRTGSDFFCHTQTPHGHPGCRRYFLRPQVPPRTAPAREDRTTRTCTERQNSSWRTCCCGKCRQDHPSVFDQPIVRNTGSNMRAASAQLAGSWTSMLPPQCPGAQTDSRLCVCRSRENSSCLRRPRRFRNRKRHCCRRHGRLGGSRSAC